MITLEDAIEKMGEFLKRLEVIPPMDLALLENMTIEFEYGWAFFYQSKEYIETGNIMSKLGGNGAIIINKFDGSLLQTGSAHTAEKYIADYIKMIKGEN